MLVWPRAGSWCVCGCVDVCAGVCVHMGVSNLTLQTWGRVWGWVGKHVAVPRLCICSVCLTRSE